MNHFPFTKTLLSCVVRGFHNMDSGKKNLSSGHPIEAKLCDNALSSLNPSILVRRFTAASSLSSSSSSAETNGLTF